MVVTVSDSTQTGSAFTRYPQALIRGVSIIECRRVLNCYSIKAGARFLLNETEFDSIIYLESNIVVYLKYIKDYFVRLASQKETFTQYPTRSGRNVLNDVFPFEDLLKMKAS